MNCSKDLWRGIPLLLLEEISPRCTCYLHLLKHWYFSKHCSPIQNAWEQYCSELLQFGKYLPSMDLQMFMLGDLHTFLWNVLLIIWCYLSHQLCIFLVFTHMHDLLISQLNNVFYTKPNMGETEFLWQSS